MKDIIHIFLIIIGRLGYMSTLTYWSFCFLYVFICFFDAAHIGYKYVSVAIIPRI